MPLHVPVPLPDHAEFPSPSPTPTLPTTSLSSLPPPERPQKQEQCLNTSDTLLVIGVTCVLNFVVVLFMLAIVHLCNRRTSRIPFAKPEMEVLANADCIHEFKHRHRRNSWAGSIQAGCESTQRFLRVRDYVNSLPDFPSLSATEDENDDYIEVSGVKGDSCMDVSLKNIEMFEMIKADIRPNKSNTSHNSCRERSRSLEELLISG